MGSAAEKVNLKRSMNLTDGNRKVSRSEIYNVWENH